jgi:transposase
MFVRIKPSGNRKYLQIVENYRDGKKVKQRVIVTLGRAEQLITAGKTDGLAKSLIRFCRQVKLVEGHRNGTVQAHSNLKIGPSLIFERLWQRLNISHVLAEELNERKFEYSVERAVFLTVLHRLFSPGSDRAAEKWKRDYKIEDADNLELHHLYRAMVWLGDNYQILEEKLFNRRKDLFSSLDLVFFDTTSIYFEGKGGDLGKRGHSKDHRPHLNQMIVGAVIDKTGRPVCCEMWQGNMSDAKTLMPVIDRLRRRFGIGRVTFVADRGMISRKTIAELEKRDMPYILGARMRNDKAVRDDVLSSPGRFHKVDDTLQVKEVKLDGRRYVICFNPGEAKKDAADQATIIAALQDKLKQGPKSLVGNKGYRKYLNIKGDAVSIDQAKIQSEARYDGKYVLVTNLSGEELETSEVALRYKELWQVENLFRSMKSVLNTRPIYHQNDASIKGHVFCSFLALMLMKELQMRIRDKGWEMEWADVKRDLEALCEVEISDADQVYHLRTNLVGICGKVFQAAGVAIPPTVRN